MIEHRLCVDSSLGSDQRDRKDPSYPYQSLAAALAAAAQVPTEPVVIKLAGGQYRLAAPVLVDARRTPSTALVIRAADPAKPPILTGGASPLSRRPRLDQWWRSYTYERDAAGRRRRLDHQARRRGEVLTIDEQGGEPMTHQADDRKAGPFVLAIDPSSTRTGYAMMDNRAKLIEVGLLLPNNPRGDPWMRTLDMVDEFRKLLEAHRPEHVVIEVPTHTHRRQFGKPGNLIVYSMAVGAFCMAAYLHPYGNTHRVPANVWTEGKAKARRQAVIFLLYSAYQPKRDPGLDMADAIGLGRWWIDQWRANVGRRIEHADPGH